MWPQTRPPSMTGPDPRTRCICTCTRAEHETRFHELSSRVRAPFQRRSLNNADSSGEMIASRYRTAPADTLFFFLLLLFYAVAVCGGRRGERTITNNALFGTLPGGGMPRVRASLADCRTFRGSLSVFVNLSVKSRSCGGICFDRAG